jgi:dTDP-4-dehydrorhamnose reductase
MKLLITGAGGQVGTELLAVLADHQVTGLTHAQLDVGDRDAVRAAVTGLRPEAVVHAAAWTAVDACEGDPDRAFRDNAEATAHVAEAAQEVGATVCYLSTDYVFDGTKAEPYVEGDPTNPRSVYGRSKLAGEEALPDGSTIVRTSWVCGRHGPNMVKTILRLAAEPGPLRFVDDQRGHPTFADDLAAMVARLVVERHRGLFHVTNQGPVTWFEFAREVLAAAGHDPARVEPIATADLDPPRPAPRPANSVLATTRLQAAGIPLLDEHRVPLERLVAALEG